MGAQPALPQTLLPRHGRQLAILACLSAGLGLQHVSAQSGVVRLADPKSFHESFVPNPTVSGRLVVGVHLGRAAGTYQNQNVSIAAPRSASAQPFCVRVTTQDARYWALNKYVADRSPGLARLESPSRFSKELSLYNANQVAIRIIAAPDCHEDSDGPLIPAVLSGATPRNNSSYS